MARRKPITADRPVAALTKAVARLQKADTNLKRRNARKLVLSELKRLRTFIDKTYPVERKAGKRAPKQPTPVRIRRMLNNGFDYMPRTSAKFTEALVMAGIKPKQIGDELLVPDWVVVVYDDYRSSEWIEILKECKKSPKARAAFLAELALKEAGI